MCLKHLCTFNVYEARISKTRLHYRDALTDQCHLLSFQFRPGGFHGLGIVYVPEQSTL